MIHIKKPILYWLEKNLKTCSILAMLLVCTTFSSCEKELPYNTAKNTTFVKIYGGSKNQQGSDIKATPDGGYI
ncbi:MAG: hypothetical protein M3512_16445, partial [Bacteroidota bacterium]|nr:hypothetical protein [Bacteroidota bacterium]